MKRWRRSYVSSPFSQSLLTSSFQSLPPLSSVASSAPAAKAPTTKANDAPLPFNLSLTDNQRTAREGVILPYLPKEDGSVDYIPDQRDDFDDDDPDEDLEI